MNAFSIEPMAKSLVDNIRRTRRDNYGQKVEVHLAGEGGYGPCRSCLKQFTPDEERILFGYAPHPSKTAYSEVGPVYIHNEVCEHYSDSRRFPTEVVDGRLPIHLSLRAYNSERRMIHAIPVNGDPVESVIAKLFADSETEMIQVRNGAAGCFIANISRVAVAAEFIDDGSKR